MRPGVRFHRLREARAGPNGWAQAGRPEQPSGRPQCGAGYVDRQPPWPGAATLRSAAARTFLSRAGGRCAARVARNGDGGGLGGAVKRRRPGADHRGAPTAAKLLGTDVIHGPRSLEEGAEIRRDLADYRAAGGAWIAEQCERRVEMLCAHASAPVSTLQPSNLGLRQRTVPLFRPRSGSTSRFAKRA